ncbi:TonB-dependent receptor [Acinetobacter sp. WC-323]|uniref:energy transducer TonB n=1 Tax=Acinetobacter sp. WC-323 TaxID=903918 RepID=UPI00029E3475|nr:TonB-dependent receptor [Acinetobacter sp. WC-323]EKU59474.1 TonB-dependent receptor [Acinetobacter sp. WC-323]
MLNKLFFCALFLSLSGCATTQVDYIKEDELDLPTMTIYVIDGVEYEHEIIKTIGKNWIYFPNISLRNSELENRYRDLEFLAFIDERGYVRHIKVLKSSGLETLDRKIVNLVINWARSKIWLKDGKPHRFIALQKLEFYPE